MIEEKKPQIVQPRPPSVASSPWQGGIRIGGIRILGTEGFGPTPHSYPDHVLQAAVPLFEGIFVSTGDYDSHGEFRLRIEDLIGRVVNARFEKSAIYGDLDLTRLGAILCKNQDAAKIRDYLCLHQLVRFDDDVQVVSKIEHVQYLFFVSSPPAVQCDQPEIVK